MTETTNTPASLDDGTLRTAFCHIGFPGAAGDTLIKQLTADQRAQLKKCVDEKGVPNDKFKTTWQDIADAMKATTAPENTASETVTENEGGDDA